MKRFACGLALVFGLGANCSVQAQQWADLKMKIVLEGEIPKEIYTDADAKDKCGAGKPGVPSEKLVVNPTNKGIANVAFYVDTRKTKLAATNIHPSLSAVPEAKPVLDNVKCQFFPHVMAIRAGQTLEVKNSDEVAHNAKFAFFDNEEVNPTVPAKSSVSVKTKKEEKSPTKVECNIHPWMAAHVLVLDHPYFGISDADGAITIEKLPAGVELEFKLWHENSNKSIEEIKVNGKSESWKKGATKLTLKEGMNDLGTITINVDRFKAVK